MLIAHSILSLYLYIGTHPSMHWTNSYWIPTISTGQVTEVAKTNEMIVDSLSVSKQIFKIMDPIFMVFDSEFKLELYSVGGCGGEGHSLVCHSMREILR